jgi:hypothetical protein
MRRIGTATEEEVVLAWVRAEYDSTQPAGYAIRAALNHDPTFIDETARASDATQHAAREAALAQARGYGANNYLFRNFPSVDWGVRLALTFDELGELRYLNHKDWVSLSGGSRLVQHGAENVGVVAVPDYITDKVVAIEKGLREGATHPELIVVAEDPRGPHILLEGHGRATAYRRVLPSDAEVEVFAAYSPDVRRWDQAQWV